MENFDLSTIIALVTTAISLGLVAAIKKIIKECKEVYNTWILINEDKKLTEKELLKFATECMDVIHEVIKLRSLFKKIKK